MCKVAATCKVSPWPYLEGHIKAYLNHRLLLDSIVHSVVRVRSWYCLGLKGHPQLVDMLWSGRYHGTKRTSQIDRWTLVKRDILVLSGTKGTSWIDGWTVCCLREIPDRWILCCQGDILVLSRNIGTSRTAGHSVVRGTGIRVLSGTKGKIPDR